MKRVLITDKLHQCCIQSFNEAGYEVDYFTDLSKEQLIDTIADYNVLIVRSATKVTAEIIEKGEKLEIIGRAGSGVDNIDVKSATRKGIIVMNTPGGNTISAAELAFAHMMALCRMIPQADRSMKSGEWDRKSFYGTELFGKKLGIIGLGQIGKEVALRAKAFHMNVLGFDPMVTKEWAGANDIVLTNLQTIFTEADIITFHVPLNDQTRNLISDKEIQLFKKGIKLINCARGGILDEKAILAGLNSGKIGGVALDVYEEEPPQNLELINHKNTICSPHLGASTEDALEKVAKQIADQVIDFYKGNKLVGSINADAIKYLSDKELSPYIDLAEKIGKIFSIISNSQLIYNLELSGSFLQKHSVVLNLALLKGMLVNKLNSPVNYINAKLLAESSNILGTVSDTPDDEHYNNLISLSFNIGESVRRISGTVLNNVPRIVRIDSYTIEFEPEGYMIMYSNVDKPGVLAKVSKILAENNINIAGLALGRKNRGEEALTIMNIDEPVSIEILGRLEKIDEINGVTSLNI